MMILLSSKVKRTELATHHKIVMESGGVYDKLDDEHVYVRVSFDDPEQYLRYVKLMKEHLTK